LHTEAYRLIRRRAFTIIAGKPDCGVADVRTLVD
jgi:hypothetical protein